MALSNTWDIASPANSDAISAGAGAIRRTKIDVAERYGQPSDQWATGEAMIAAIGSVATRVIVVSSLSFTTDATIPATLELVITRAGSISVAVAKTLTILSPFEAPSFTWATGAGTIVLPTKTVTQLVTTTKAIDEAQGADIASATTTSISAATGNYVKVTGTTTITGLGTVQAGARRIVEFTGALILTHNAASLILPTGANITTAAGDVATFISEGSGNWRCAGYMRANGDPLGTAITAINASGTGTIPTLLEPGMRIIRGSYDYNSGTPITVGAGWSAVRNSAGVVTITITSPFSIAPVVVVSQGTDEPTTASYGSVTTSSFIVYTQGASFHVDRPLSFIAIGAT